VQSSPDAAAGVLEQILAVEEAFIDAHYLIMDLRPQNVFFDPQCGEIRVIDIGTSVDLTVGAGSRSAADVHDCLAELCKFYLAPQTPPLQVQGYRDPFGMGPALGFSKELERMIQASSALQAGALQDIVVGILDRLKRRDYGAVAPFRDDLRQYRTLVDERNRHLPAYPDLVEAWRQGMTLLRETHWRKFRFDPDTDLAPYA
jgi:hypothetical protein